MTDNRQTADALIPPSAHPSALPSEPSEWTFTRPPGVPSQGIYTGKSYEWYAAIEAVNATALKVGAVKSPKHLLATIEGRMASDSKARKFGRAIHIRLLEPSRYRTAVMFSTPCAAILKSGIRKGEPCGCDASYYSKDQDIWVCGKHTNSFPDAATPTDFVSPDEAVRIERMVDAIQSHRAMRLLRSFGGCEVTLIWDDDNGIIGKARLDKHIFGSDCKNTILDLKKTTSGSLDDDSINKAIRKYGYDIGAWWYQRGAEIVTGEPHNYLWCFLEDSEPYDLRVVFATAARLEIGRCKANRAFGRYKHGLRTGEWPGTSDEIDELEPDAFECKRYGIQ